MEYLSNIELYYSPQDCFTQDKIVLAGEEAYHAAKVMRHKPGDNIFVTDGHGKICGCRIVSVDKERLLLQIGEEHNYVNKFNMIYFCIPRLKNNDRFEFAVEKCIELGVTNFIVYDAERAVAKGNKTARWNKIGLAAMKQSLRSFLPEFIFTDSLEKIADKDGVKYIFEQNTINKFAAEEKIFKEKSYFIFGPEGGLSSTEIGLFDTSEVYKLADNRLRSETAIIVCAGRL